TKQRNFGIRMARAFSPDVVYFFDDDIEVHRDYFNTVETLLEQRPDIVAGSGTTLADGNITREEARALVDRTDTPATDAFRIDGKHWTLYGCNMFMRASAFERVAFDERLPLYSWGEDYAISIALRSLGLVGRFNRALCIHLKTTGARLRPAHLAFSMSSNVFYFFRTGCTHTRGVTSIVRFFYVLTFWIPFAEVRRRRMTSVQTLQWWGGWLQAIGEMVTGRSRPENLLLR